jgi:hypothetical protein
LLLNSMRNTQKRRRRQKKNNGLISPLFLLHTKKFSTAHLALEWENNNPAMVCTIVWSHYQSCKLHQTMGERMYFLICIRGLCFSHSFRGFKVARALRRYGGQCAGAGCCVLFMRGWVLVFPLFFCRLVFATWCACYV